MNTHPQIKQLEYNYITDGIYIGTNQCCQTHFDAKLKKKGISADVSLEEERIDAPFGVHFYVWIPVKNHTAPTQRQLDFGVAILERFVAIKEKTYVHCQNGHGRAPTLVAAYLIRRGMGLDDALAFIKRRRPSIHLERAQKQALAKFLRKERIDKQPLRHKL